MAKYVQAILLDGIGNGILQPLKYMIIPGVFYVKMGAKSYLLAAPPDDVQICHIPQGLTTRVIQYDMRYAIPLSGDILRRIVEVLHTITEEYSTEITFDGIRRLLGRGRTHSSIEDYLKKIDEVRRPGLAKFAFKVRAAEQMQEELIEWVKSLPAGILAKPMPHMYNLLSGGVTIQSAMHMGRVTDIAIRHRDRLESISNVKEPKDNRMLIMVALIMLVVVMVAGVYVVASDDTLDIPILSDMLPSTMSQSAAPSVVNADPCSPESLQANYVDGTDAALAIHKGELDCDPNEIPGEVGLLIQSSYDPEVLDWIIENEDIAGGGPMDAVSGAVEELVP